MSQLRDRCDTIARLAKISGERKERQDAMTLVDWWDTCWRLLPRLKHPRSRFVFEQALEESEADMQEFLEKRNKRA